MKLIQAMKQLKDLTFKHDDLVRKVAAHSAYLSTESPVYPDQGRQVAEWLQACEDIVQRMMYLHIAIQRTNLVTPVTIELGGKQVTKSIAEWVLRRRAYAGRDFQAWTKLTDRNLREGTVKNSLGQDVEVKIVRCYNPVSRDAKVELYRSEPAIIDGVLEITNAVTDLIES